jgi:pyrroloquinoline quinone biosynthesis protein D
LSDPSEGQATFIGLAPNSRTRPRRRADIVLQDVGGEAILIDPKTDEAHVLNGSAARLWQLCDGERSIDEIAAEFGALYELSAADVIDDVREVVDDLVKLNLVESPAPAGA